MSAHEGGQLLVPDEDHSTGAAWRAPQLQTVAALPSHIPPCTPEEQAEHVADLAAAICGFAVGVALRTSTSVHTCEERPMASDEIRALLEQGLNNRVIARRTGVDARDVARIRKEAGIAPAPRSSWTRRTHPKEDAICGLLNEGHTDSAIRESTGADVRTIARMRREGGIGPATVVRRGKRPHPKEAAIRELLAQGKTTAAIVREVGADPSAVRRIRREAGVPNPPAQPLTLDEAWAQRTRRVDGGHLEWTGSRANASRTPVMRYRDTMYTAAALAFRQRTGRAPVGQVKAECGMAQCVEPTHVEDEPGRARVREQLRHVMGMGARKPYCRSGHDQAEHGSYSPDGVAYCKACHGEKKALRAEATR